MIQTPPASFYPSIPSLLIALRYWLSCRAAGAVGFKSFQIAHRVEKHGLGASEIVRLGIYIYIYIDASKGSETIKQSTTVIKQSHRNAWRHAFVRLQKDRIEYAFVCLFVCLMRETILSDHCETLQTEIKASFSKFKINGI